MKKIILIFSILLLSLISCNRPVEIDNSNDYIPPTVPTNVNIYYAFDGEIGIEWDSNPELDLNGYNVYRKTDSTSYKLISFTTDNYYVDDSLDYNTIYYYEITAVDNSGLESSASSEVSAKPLNFYTPYPPQNITINARNWEDSVSIYLSWIPSGETDISGYNIYRSIISSFTPDTSTLLTFTKNNYYSDTSGLTFYTSYYYKIKALDKGGLISNESPEVNDEIFEIPELIFPKNNSSVSYFGNFTIKAIKVPATYEVVLQTNEYFGEIWSNTISSTITNDTLNIAFNINYIDANTLYYWRVITFSQDNSEPNSISMLYKFMIKQ